MTAPESGSDDAKSPLVMAIEANEDLIQHIEQGESRIKLLSVITTVVACLLAASYFSQIVLPFAGGPRYETVDLLNPSLLIFEVVLLLLSAAWVYVGVVNYLFSTRLGRQVREIREAERELEKKIAGGTSL